MQKKRDVSVIIVYYNNYLLLTKCLRSIYNSNPKRLKEIVVVDNSEKPIKKKLLRMFSKIVYINSGNNIGYAAGNNLGVRYAKGSKVLILNPDTEFKNNIVDKLAVELEKKDTGIVAPILLDKNDKIFIKQGTANLGVLEGIFALSFINKIWPDNPVSKKFWLKSTNRNKNHKVDVVPGTCFMVSKADFNLIGGFDPMFFLYFEESDFCRRFKKLGKKIMIIPNAKLAHYWEAVKKEKSLQKYYDNSRDYYFEKHFGKLTSLLIRFFAGLSRKKLINYLYLTTLITAGFTVFSYKLTDNFYFSSEVAHNLLAVKNAIVQNSIPLYGPPTSHAWLYFGPMYYWLMAPLVLIFDFNPFIVPWTGVAFGLITLILNYSIVSKILNKKTALISSVFIVFSPLIIDLVRDGRFFYITVLVSYVFIYQLYKLYKNKKCNLYLLGFTFGLFFHFHYTPIVLVVPAFAVIYFSKIKINLQFLLKLAIGLTATMLPLIVFDARNKFEMFTKLFLWIPYRILGFSGVIEKNNVSADTISTTFNTFLRFVSYNSILDYSLGVVSAILIVLFLFSFANSVKNLKHKKFWDIYFVFSILTMVGSVIILGDAPIHYFLPVLTFPIIAISKQISDFINLPKNSARNILLLSVFLVLAILYVRANQNRFYKSVDNPVNYEVVKKVAQVIETDSEGKEFILNRVGPNDQFEGDYAQNYQYLLWLYGNEPVEDAELLYTIYEEDYDGSGEIVDTIEGVIITKK